MNAIDFDYMRETAALTFFDTCRLGAVPEFEYGSLDSVPEDPLYSDGQPCGFEPGRRGEVEDGSQAPIYDAILRLPVTASVASIDRVELTHRHGTALASPQIYAVVGAPELGPSANVLTLKLITGESIK
jgi:hypothetical protein